MVKIKQRTNSNGILSLLIDPKSFKKLQDTKKSEGSAGRPEVFSDAIIEFLGYVKTH